MTFARELWLRIETINAVSYFGAATTDAARALGLGGFWLSYFGFRAAPLGPVGPGTVEAVFFNFAPSFVARWVPEVWATATPEALLAARSGAAAATLRELAPHADAVAATVDARLAGAVAAGVAAGRPLFAANREVVVPDDPVEALWQRCTTLREHRGDGHVAALTAAGLDGCQAHVLIAAQQRHDPDDLQRSRGWTTDDWAAATDRCIANGLLDDSGALTAAGVDLRQRVERTTDVLAAAPFADLGAPGQDQLLLDLDRLAVTVAQGGVIRYPNPMGLPSLA